MAGTIYSLNALSQLIIRRFKQFRPGADDHIDEREVGMHIRTKTAELMHFQWFERRNAREVKGLPALYIATFNGVQVLEDPDSKENYADLPAIPEEFADGSGIQNVYPDKPNFTNEDPMIPIPANAHVIFNQLPAGALEHQWGYRPERFRIVFKKKGGKTLLEENIKNVNMQLITVGPEDVANDQPFPISHYLVPRLIREVLAEFGVTVPVEQDTVNDNQ